MVTSRADGWTGGRRESVNVQWITRDENL